MRSVSEGIDDLIAQMTDAATGHTASTKARMVFYATLKKGSNEEGAWRMAITAAGGNLHKAHEAADSLAMGGHDYAVTLKHPDRSAVTVEEQTRTAYHEFSGCGLGDAVARQLWELWKEYYGSEDYSKNYVSEAKQTGPSPTGWVQIDGDFGDPWASGGTWFNEGTGMILHHDELTDKEWNGVDEEDPRIDAMMTPVDYQNIVNDLTVERDEAWEATESNARSGHAEVFNANRKFPYYETMVEDDAVIESDWADDIAKIKEQFENGEQVWAAMTPAQKMVELANYKGWYEFDYDGSTATKAELSVKLGIDL